MHNEKLKKIIEKMVSHVQILTEAVCISLHINAIG